MKTPDSNSETQNELLQEEAAVYRKMSLKERIRCFDEIMQLWSSLRPRDVKYKDGEPPLAKLWNRKFKKTPLA